MGDMVSQMCGSGSGSGCVLLWCPCMVGDGVDMLLSGSAGGSHESAAGSDGVALLCDGEGVGGGADGE